MKRESGSERKRERESTPPPGEIPLQSPEETTVEYLPSAPKGPPGKRIHPRRPLPPVPEGTPEPDPDPSPPAEIESGKEGRRHDAASSAGASDS
jgi:hypothetical protein